MQITSTYLSELVYVLAGVRSGEGEFFHHRPPAAAAALALALGHTPALVHFCSQADHGHNGVTLGRFVLGRPEFANTLLAHISALMCGKTFSPPERGPSVVSAREKLGQNFKRIKTSAEARVKLLEPSKLGD